MAALQVPVTPADHIQGPEHAPVTLVEYGDYQCGFCRTAHSTIQQVQEYFGRDLRFVFRHFPLVEIHPHAQAAAEAAEFAGAEGRFWAMHDGIYQNQAQLEVSLLFSLARGLALSETGLRDALDTGLFREMVESDFLGGVRSGVKGTPAFFINQRRHQGSFEYHELVAAIEAALEDQSAQAAVGGR